MTPLHALLIATFTWIIWVPTVILEHKAKGKAGGISLFPVPLAPLVAWGLAHLLEYIYPGFGAAIIAGAHVILLAAMLLSIIQCSRSIINSNTGKK